MSQRPWWPGQDEQPDLAEKLLAPRGHAHVTAMDRGDAIRELTAEGVPLFEHHTPIPGYWHHDISPVAVKRESERLIRDRAQLIANARRDGQYVNTTQNMKESSR